MNIRLTPLLPSQVVGKIPSMVKKECIESDVEEAEAKGNNLAVPSKTDAKTVFDKKKADAAEDVVYHEDDESGDKAEKKAKKDAKKLRETRWDDDYDRDDDDQKYTDQADKAERDREKADRDDEKSGSPQIFKQKNEGVNMPMFREMIRNTERALKLTEEPKSLTKGDLRTLVKEEYVKILDEQRKGAVKIEKKLHELREDLIAELFKRTSTTKEQVGRPPLVKTLQLKTVSELIEVPVNELTLYFLNNVKGSNTHHLIEYHLGHIYFYAN